MTYARPIPRPTLEEYVEFLSTKYPRCFFVDPRMRQPLKKGIVADLEKDQALDDEKRAAAIAFYTNDWTYQRALQAGVERVDLDGNKAGTVTELEQRTAQRQIQQDKKRLSERNAGNPISILNQLHAAGRIPTDSLSKLAAPRIVTPMKKPEPPKNAALAPPEPARIAERLETLVASLHDINTKDRELKVTLIIATANMLLTEAQKLVALARETAHD